MAARRVKEEKYRELLAGDRCRLVVVGIETGGRWSPEAVEFVDMLAGARAREAPPHILLGVAGGGGCWRCHALVHSPILWCPDRRTQWAQTGQRLISRTSSRREARVRMFLVWDCFSRFYSFSSRVSPKKNLIRSLLRCHVARQGCIWDAAASCRERLLDVSFEAPPWQDLQRGALPRQHELDDALKRHGWQFGASQEVDDYFLSGDLWPRLSLPSRALLRSQGGPLAGLPFTCFPIAAHSRFDAQPVRVLLFSSVACGSPLPSSARNCRCGLPLDSQWPPPRSLCSGRGSGSQGLRSRECGTRLQRSRSQSLTQRSRSRHGPGSSERFRQSPSGDRGRRLASVPRSSISSGHDSGFCAPKGWDTTPTMCHHGRCSS